MKVWIQKIKEFYKKNYIACTVVGALLLTIIASLIIVSLIRSFKNKIEVSSKNGSYYQYVDSDIKTFKATLSYENDKIVNIKSDTHNIYVNSPLYSEDNKEIIIPKTSSIVFYLKNNETYRLPIYSTLTNTDSINYISSNGQKESTEGFFIYDGVDTYIIPSKSTLKVNKETINLGTYSYVIANSSYVIYYDYEKNIVGKIDDINSASLTVDDIAIDLLKDVTVNNNKVQLLLTDINGLKVYLED